MNSISVLLLRQGLRNAPHSPILLLHCNKRRHLLGCFGSWSYHHTGPVSTFQYQCTSLLPQCHNPTAGDYWGWFNSRSYHHTGPVSTFYDA
jgi:hypothetical protein